MASNSGFTALLLIGLVALGASGDPGCDTQTDIVPAGESDADDDFSFDPEAGQGVPAGTPSGAEAVDESGADDDFSFEPETG